MSDSEATSAHLRQRSGKDLLLESLGILRKQIWYALLVFVLTVSAVAFWNFRQTPLYEARATLIIDAQPPRVLSDVREVVELGTGTFWSSREYYETQYKVIASRSIAEAVVRRGGLADKRDFVGEMKPGPDGEEPGWQDRFDKAVALVRGGLQVEPVPDSRVVRLVYRHPVAAMAKEAAELVATVYEDSNLAFRSKATEKATDSLQLQVGELRRELREAEDALATFKRDKGILVANVEAQQAILGDQIQELSRTISQAESERERLEARLVRVRTVDMDAEWGSLEEAQASHLLAQLKETYLRLKQERIKLAVDLLGKHPKVRTVEQQIRLVRKAMDDEVKLIVSHLERKLASLRDAETAHRVRLGALETRARSLDDLGLQFERLKRKVQAQRSLYDMVLVRLRETHLTGQFAANNVRVLDPPQLPLAPVTPRTRLNLALGLLLGLLGGVAFAFFMEYLDRTIRTREDVEALGLPFLGIGPAVRTADLGPDERVDLFVAEHPRSSAAECARIVRTNLMFAFPGGDLRRVAVSSASPKEGKTHTALNVAVTMALSGKRTLLVDSDLRRPRLHKALGQHNREGLSNFIVQAPPIEELIQATGVDNLEFLACGPIPPNPAELLESERFREVLDELSDRYDRVVLDSPPIMAVADPLIISRHTDGVIMVIRSGSTSREMAFRSVQALRDAKARVLGAVLNNVDVSKPAYSRYYYYYRHGYQGYYQSEGEPELGSGDRGEPA